MKKFVAYLCFLVLVPLLFLSIVSFNLSKVFLDLPAIKSVFSESGVYEGVSGFFQEMTANDKNLDKNNKKLLAQLNEGLSVESIKKMSESVIDQAYEGRKNPKNVKITYEFPSFELGTTEVLGIPQDTYLKDNFYMVVWGNLENIILAFSIASALFFIFIMLLAPTWSARMVWTSSISLVVLISLGAVYGASITIGKMVPDLLMKGQKYLGDPKLMAAGAKLFDGFWELQRQYYLIEIIGLAVLFILMLASGLISAKKKEELSMEKLDNSKTDLSNLPKQGIEKKKS